jgi:hypothetical protein
MLGTIRTHAIKVGSCHGGALPSAARSGCQRREREGQRGVKNHPILLANPEISFYCTNIKFLMDATKINKAACPDVYHEAFFYQFNTINIFVVEIMCKIRCAV